MPKLVRIVGLPGGAADPDRQEVRFTLLTGEGKEINCVAKTGVAEQLSSGVARMVAAVRDIRTKASKPNVEAGAAESVLEAMIQREPWADRVILRLVSTSGIPFNFALTVDEAKQIAERLRAESVKTDKPGTA